MPKSKLPLVPVFLFALATAAVRAQVPADSLGGKTIHVYLPSGAIDSLFVWNLNAAMTKEAPFWYSYTFARSGLYDNTDGVYFTDLTRRFIFSKSGLGRVEGPRILVSDFQGSKDLWIIVDPAGSEYAPPILMTEPPKRVNILNPWPMTAPKLVSGGKSLKMTAVPGRCGWFSAMLLDPTLTQGHFSEVSGAGTYGKAGMDGSGDFDFAGMFGKSGPEIWLNTGTNAWSGDFPGVEGACGYRMAMTVRDFSKNHPDFDFGSISGERLLKGVVKPVLGPSRKPMLDSTRAPDPLITYGHFDEWWVTDSTHADPALRSYESCYDLPVSQPGDGLWEYDSYRDSPDHGFWPAEATANRTNESMATCYNKPPPDTTFWGTGGPKRNGNFCVESHASFVYRPGQKFYFRGDDDFWIFINDRLVVDLGGVHTPKSDSVDLDKLGLTAGATYKWDLFLCDRQPCGSSLRIKTSIFFDQPRPLFVKASPGPAPGSVSLEIWRRSGGAGSCAAEKQGEADSAKAANLGYRLLDQAGRSVKDLSNPSTHYNGAIVLAEPVITLDTTKFAGTGLVPGGAYSLMAYAPANPNVRVEFPFRVPGTTALRPHRVAPRGPRAKARYRNVLGRRVQASPGIPVLKESRP